MTLEDSVTVQGNVSHNAGEPRPTCHAAAGEDDMPSFGTPHPAAVTRMPKDRVRRLVILGYCQSPNHRFGPIRPFVDEFKARSCGDAAIPKTLDRSALMYMHVRRDPDQNWAAA